MQHVCRILDSSLLNLSVFCRLVRKKKKKVKKLVFSAQSAQRGVKRSTSHFIPPITTRMFGSSGSQCAYNDPNLSLFKSFPPLSFNFLLKLNHQTFKFGHTHTGYSHSSATSHFSSRVFPNQIKNVKFLFCHRSHTHSHISFRCSPRNTNVKRFFIAAQTGPGWIFKGREVQFFLSPPRFDLRPKFQNFQSSLDLLI